MRFSATLPLLRRVRNFQLTTKNGPKDYYKGTRSGNTGRHTKHGGFVVDFDKVRTYVVPEGLANFKVCLPFVFLVCRKRKEDRVISYKGLG